MPKFRNSFLLLGCSLLLLGSAYAPAAASCPPGCECSEAAHTVKCVAKELRSVPLGIPGYARNLFITGNQIMRIGPESFKGLENVTNLSLSNNRISEVESHTFSSLTSLRSLDLSCNQLAVLHPEALTVAERSLRELNLSRALYNRSGILDLSAALRHSSLTSLRGLDLSHNSIIYLPPGMFTRLGGLRRLLLTNNSLVAFHNATLAGLGDLQELDLTLNSLRNVPEEGLRELDSLPEAEILLGENPFTCTCGIEPFARWLNRSRGRIRNPDQMMCAFPANLRNASLLSVVGASGSLGCRPRGAGAELALQTSYVFLGLVLGLVGLVFLLVLYLNRRGIKKRVYDMRDACREVWEGYHYRFETDSDPRLSQVSSSTDM
ncbi:trophoblast glycoprotein a [Corythoichthys intestinalis]|uniref:trophoblast glycoprotein a n=1 Tax=Corythoichthys intestinalis TaxID=161448 RepID=UPI0025A5CE33|nr:trophoblast glycoprotein a [Corythoichthys intestinalis]XP_061808761.1 trophoblast glycoprotein-like [Nerophis lumbriciformis]